MARSAFVFEFPFFFLAEESFKIVIDFIWARLWEKTDKWPFVPEPAVFR